MKEIPYASAIDSLMFALVYTRPDIRYAVGLLDRYQSNPGLEHWKAVKNVMKCLKGTKEYKFMYRHTDQLEVIGYSDSDFARCVRTRKSTSGYIFFFFLEVLYLGEVLTKHLLLHLLWRKILLGAIKLQHRHYG